MLGRIVDIILAPSTSKEVPRYASVEFLRKRAVRFPSPHATLITIAFLPGNKRAELHPRREVWGYRVGAEL